MTRPTNPRATIVSMVAPQAPNSYPMASPRVHGPILQWKQHAPAIPPFPSSENVQCAFLSHTRSMLCFRAWAISFSVIGSGVNPSGGFLTGVELFFGLVEANISVPSRIRPATPAAAVAFKKSLRLNALHGLQLETWVVVFISFSSMACPP